MELVTYIEKVIAIIRNIKFDSVVTYEGWIKTRCSGRVLDNFREMTLPNTLLTESFTS